MIRIENVVKTFGKGKKEAVVEALRGISLSIQEGEMAAVMGKSGSGKSTLLNILGGMMSADSGTYLYDGKEVNFKSQKELVRFRRNEIGFILQYFALVDDLNVFRNVALPLKYQGYSRKKVKKMVMEALTDLGIEDKAKAYPAELSGGQQQRVAIARAIAAKPSIVLADEPTGNLDSQTEREVMGILKKCVRDYGQTLIMITHDEGIAQMADVVVMIEDGKVVK